MSFAHLNIFDSSTLNSLLQVRKGEHRLGQRLRLLDRKVEDLPALVKKGVRFAILGIPECIGPLGNGGKAGAENAFRAFLPYLLNVQSNRFLDGKELVLLGEVDLVDLQTEALQLDPNSDYYFQKLHLMCERIDERVQPIIEQIVAHGIIPIIIGGGHNNALPIISGVAAQRGPVNVLNFDAHADFRALEGRHSGNGFSYAMQRKVLNAYAVFGLHQNYNSENMLKSMDSSQGVKYTFLEDIQYTDKLLLSSIEFLQSRDCPIGLEVDMDAIRMMPSSALSPSGFSLEQMRYFVRKTTTALKPVYLHLAEAAPKTKEEEFVAGKSLAYLVTDFIKSS